jgi:branched-chain amino acid transport system permease protein
MIPFLIFSSIISGLVIFIFYKLVKSPFGRVLKGLRDDDLAVTSLGRNVTAQRVFVFVISSGFIATAGMIYATYVTYIDPTSFNLDEAIFILCAVLIGGTGNIKGPVVGAIFVVVLPELLRFVGMPDAVAANMRQIIYGLSLIVLMRYRPQGIAGNYWVK